MLFLSPLLLWFLAAAAVPVAIHLINRRRHKTIPWAAMQFLLKAARQSRGRKKLRHILILTCRALGIAALALAAARPIVSGFMGWGGGSIDTVVLVLDRSASMELKPGDGLEPRRQIVLEKVREAMAGLEGARLVLIDSASGNPQEISSPEILGEISSTAPTDTAADFPGLVTRAAEFLTEVQGRSEIWLASDLQESNWRDGDERWAAARASLASLPRRPAIRVLALSGSSAGNVSLRLIGSRRSADELLLDLEVFRFGTARSNASVPLTTQLNGTRTSENLTLPGQSLRFQKRIPLPRDSESGYGWVSTPADGNPRDSVAFFAYGPARTAKSLIVSTPGETADFLQLAAAPPGLERLEAQVIGPEQASAAINNDFAAIFWAAPFPTGPAADALRSYLSSGGHVVFLAPGSNSDASFNDMKWSPVAEADPGKFYILKDWNRADGPLRDSVDGSSVAGNRLKAIRRQVPMGDATPLATWEDGEAFLSRRIADHGTLWFLGSIPDYRWSNLGDADVLLPAIQRILVTGLSRYDASYIAALGSSASRPRPGETLNRIDDYATKDPGNSAYEAGIFRIGERLIALNRPASEDTQETLPREALDTVLEGTGYTLLDQVGQGDDPSLARDVWRAFLIAMLLFLIAEALLCLPKKEALNPKHEFQNKDSNAPFPLKSP